MNRYPRGLWKLLANFVSTVVRNADICDGSSCLGLGKRRFRGALIANYTTSRLWSDPKSAPGKILILDADDFQRVFSKIKSIWFLNRSPGDFHGDFQSWCWKQVFKKVVATPYLTNLFTFADSVIATPFRLEWVTHERYMVLPNEVWKWPLPHIRVSLTPSTLRLWHSISFSRFVNLPGLSNPLTFQVPIRFVMRIENLLPDFLFSKLQ